MRKAFSMIELIFVIVIIGIIASITIQSIKTNPNTEDAILLISNIKYTQHLALINDLYNSKNKDWYKNRWHIEFKENSYSIKSGATFALEPLGKKEMKDIKISGNFSFDNGCKNLKYLIFDSFGRPLLTNPQDYNKPYKNENLETILKKNCKIILKLGKEKMIIKIEKETGFARFEND